MTAKTPKAPATTQDATAAPAQNPPRYVDGIGGSKSQDWNLMLLEQTAYSIRTGGADAAQVAQRVEATAIALKSIAPRDELEGMIAAQLIAAHNASMDCYHRAMAPEQSHERRRDNLSQAAKVSRTWTALLEALNRYRGKGQQKVTVEHVHVHNGGQAVVGTVETTGGGAHGKA
jgi:hypothetical protein